MDAARNPFAPGAGSQPPELAGRDSLLAAAKTSLIRAGQGRHARPLILLGLRGTGKTVLLNRISQFARETHHAVTFIEASERGALPELLYPQLVRVANSFTTVAAAKGAVLKFLSALKAFALRMKIKVDDVSISFDPEPGSADTGNLELDIPELFLRIGEAAKAAGRAWTLLIDEIQYLTEKELAAVIAALHRTNQLALPIAFFGAGLPQIAALAGEAKSYAERLFEFPVVGALDKPAAEAAIKQPIEKEGEQIDNAALEEIAKQAKGYPYFLQEWGFQAWNHAEKSPISLSDVREASMSVLDRLDQGFFRVRFDRLTPKEKEYVFAMASLGTGPFRTSDVSDSLGETPSSLGPRRASIIKKGVIYSPSHGDIDFTVPMFDEFLKRVRSQEA